MTGARAVVETYIGKPMLRGEDPRLLRGAGSFTDDIAMPRAAFAAFVRSPHAHASLLAIDCKGALRMQGVLGVLTARDWKEAGLGDLPCVADIASSDGTPMPTAWRPVFASREVCHVGDVVAAVVAATREQALDAMETVRVDYDPLASVTTPSAALAAGAPLVHEHLGTNLVQWIERGDAARVAAAFARAAHVSEVVLRQPRVSANPMEPRAYIARYDEANDRYALWAAGQNPHFLRRMLATYTLRIPINRLRVICPDVGGGFGVKFFCYPEQAVVLWAAKRFGRPVRWTASRSESLISDTHARDHDTRLSMAFDAEGKILALRGESTQAYGAYQSTYAPIILTAAFLQTLTGPYKVPVAHVRINGVFTNTVPIDAYRGVKQPGAYAHERLVDQAAREMGIDPAVMRLRNYIPRTEYPFVTALGQTYDSGDPTRQHETLAGLVDYAALREEQRSARTEGHLFGIGLGAVVESTGLGPSRQLAGPGIPLGGWESAQVRVHPDGRVTLFVGTHSHGQSHEITFRQVAADALGLAIEDIELTQGDTDLGPGNQGTAAARALSTAGMAVAEGGRRIIAKARQLAAHMMECAPEDIEYEHGVFRIPGTDRRLGFAQVAEMAYAGFSYPDEGFELGMDETVYYDPPAWGFPTALHLAVVRVDEETGAVAIRDYYTVDDCGRVINPIIVHGQVHGGLAQGIGQALLEAVVYDADSGQLLSGSFADYAMPRAADLPSFRLAFQETLNPNNVLGVKGCSETGVAGAPAALANAVLDALTDLGVRDLQLPFTAERVWRAIRDARGELGEPMRRMRTGAPDSRFG